ncbi:hypothetical protein [Nonomuraea sp. KM90]|uniref:hypothetical protein n=1 Tax=Nonomuraea sp. KM90 TaxID=3457428 RepID=UPI003FCD7B40
MTQTGAVPGADGWIERAADVDRVVAALTSGESGLVMVVPETEGVEGMGVTAVVAAALRRAEVAERYPEGIGWVSAGGSHPDNWIDELTQVLERLHGEDMELYSWLEGHDLLGLARDEEAMNGLLETEIFTPGPRLVVIDGLRHAGLVLAMAFAAPGCAWLVTARAADEPPPFAITVRIGAMTVQEGAAMLRRDQPALDEGTATRLAELTGGWPLALAMAHGAIISQAGTGEPATEPAAEPVTESATESATESPAESATEVAARLVAGLPERTDLADPDSRAALIGAIVDHSVGRLRDVDPAAAERFLHLGLFGAGEAIPIGVAAMLWSSGGTMTGGRIGALIARLESLRLMSRRTDHPVLVLADAVGARVRELLGPEGLRRARRTLADADPDETPEGWADLPGTEEWMLRNLAGLYADAGDEERLESLVCDVTWLSTRIHHSGVEAALEDLDRSGTATAELLRLTLAGSSHLLESARELGVSVVPTLAARLHATPDKGEEARRWLAEGGGPWLEARWTPPDLPHPALLATYHSPAEQLLDLAMVPDGSWVAAAGDRGRVLRRRVDGTRMESLLPHDTRVTSVAVAPGGAWLATASWDETVRLWEPDGKPRAVLDDLPGDAETVAIAPDGTWLAAAGEGFLRFWNADGTPRAVLDDASGAYERIAIAPDGTWLAAVGRGTIELWNADGTRRPIARTSETSAEAVAIAPSGEWLAMITGPGSLLLLNADGSPRGELDSVFYHGTGLAIAPDGRRLAVGDFDDDIVIMDVDGSVRARLNAHTKAITGLAITPDGRRLVSSSEDGTIRVWDMDRAVPQGPADRPRGHDLHAVAIAPDGSYLATAGPDGFTLWDPDGGVRAQGPDEWTWSVAVAPGGAYLLTGDHEGRLQLWDPDGTLRRTEQLPSTRSMANVPSVAISHDGGWTVAAVNDEVRVLTPEGSRVLESYDEDVRAVAIAPDASWVAVASERDVRLCRPDGRPTGVRLEAESIVKAVAVSPDGRYVAAATTDGAVELFDVEGGPDGEGQGERVARFGHDDRLTGVAFSPDGAWLATTARNGCLRVWEVATRSCPAAIVVDGELSSCAWFPDGSGLCAAGAAGLFGFTYHC